METLIQFRGLSQEQWETGGAKGRTAVATLLIILLLGWGRIAEEKERERPAAACIVAL